MTVLGGSTDFDFRSIDLNQMFTQMTATQFADDMNLVLLGGSNTK
jgi:hypothetical protein